MAGIHRRWDRGAFRFPRWPDHTGGERKKSPPGWKKKSLGRGTVNFKLRDWLFSRQRYWGEPFPILWEDGQHRALDESELPLVQPDMEDFKPSGTPEPPLSRRRSG